MKENNEISALLTLIDDPDEEVYTTISNKIISLGKEIIPNLENLWENTHSEDIQERIESLIHKLHFKDLFTEFENWKNNKDGLLKAACLCAQYHYPEMQYEQVFKDIEKMRKNIWLELNNYLTPLEQTNIVNSILYSYYKLKGVETDFSAPENFLINKTLETKNGNVISNGIIYLILCELLDIPVKAINIPQQFILAYFDTSFELLNPVKIPAEKILFFIDPLNGQIHSHHDIENYFKQISVSSSPAFFRKKNNNQVISFLLTNLSKCYDDFQNNYKKKELESLVNLLIGQTI